VKLFPIGYIGLTKKNNIHSHKIWNVSAKTPFIITGYNSPGSLYPYCVKFLDKKLEDLNGKGPYLSNNCILKNAKATKAAQVLYGKP